jgi:hypothetical protein
MLATESHQTPVLQSCKLKIVSIMENSLVRIQEAYNGLSRKKC